jgi:undecaprenyl-diphosphatase
MIGTNEQRAKIWSALQWLRTHQHLTLLLALTLAVGGVWAFIEIADEVLEGDTQQFDDWAIRALRTPGDLERPLGPRWLHEVGRDATALGGVFVLIIVTVAVAGYFLMVGKRHAMWLVMAATGGGLLMSTLLKNLFDRDRPQLVPHLSHVYTSSFPSGHAMLSAVVYLTLGVLLARLVPHRGVKIYFIIIAALLSCTIGVSRVYMGVHYPTDVLAGWTAGLVWASLCYAVARYLQIRGTVERDVDEPGGAQAAKASDPQRGGSTITPPAHPSPAPAARGR